MNKHTARFTIKVRRHSLHEGGRQRGMALVIALVFLMVLTMLGVASLSGNTAQERMTYAFGNTARATQAADSAVREGEYWVSQLTTPPPVGTNPPILAATGPASTPWTQSTFSQANLADSNWWGSNGMAFNVTYAITGGSTSRNAANTMSNLNRVSGNGASTWFAVELMGRNVNLCSARAGSQSLCAYYYRITGHSGAEPGLGTTATTSTVQSVWSWPVLTTAN